MPRCDVTRSSSCVYSHAVDLKELVLTKIRELGKLDPDGTSLQLDSISIIDFVLALEDSSGIEIGNEHLTVENFRSVDDVVRLLERQSRSS